MLISDITLTWARITASLQNIPAIAFTIFPGAAGSYFTHSVLLPGTEFPFPAIRLTDYEISTMPTLAEDSDDEDDDDGCGGEEIVLMNTSRVIEGNIWTMPVN